MVDIAVLLPIRCKKTTKHRCLPPPNTTPLPLFIKLLKVVLGYVLSSCSLWGAVWMTSACTWSDPQASQRDHGTPPTDS